MLCKKCNKRIKNETPVCPYCGAPQTETVSLGQMNAAQEEGKKKKLTGKQKTKRIIIIIVSILAALALLITGGCFAMEWWWNSNVVSEEPLNEEELGINTDLPVTGVTNIALFGLDSRSDSDEGRSDAIIILSIDRDHNKIKLSSIARDTLANVENYGWNDNSREDDWTKITHAFAHGGAASAVKALNENFNMNISRYAYVNWFEFVEIIDFLGGVEIEVLDKELSNMNMHIADTVRKTGMQIDKVKSSGKQLLSGGQALVYSRLRKMDSDVMRGNRQKAVLEAAFKKVKEQPLTKYPALIKKVLGICNTNLKYDECFEIASWVLKNSPEFINYSLPDEDANLYAWGGNTGADKWGWVYIFDLDYATALLHDFIYETETANKEEAQRLTSPRFPAHMQSVTSSEE